MEITKEHRKLIENVVKKNPRFKGNEDLVEDFCSEAFKRSFSIVSTNNNIDNFEAYLNKLASSAILSVLKDSGRIKKTKIGYEKIQHTQCVEEYSTDENGDIIYNIPDPSIDIEEEVANKSEVEKIRDIIYNIDSFDKNKRYLDIFKMRYLRNLKQYQIAKELKISQGEVSKRLVELTKKINRHL